MFRIPKFVLALITLISLGFAVPVVNAATVTAGSGDSISRYPIGLDPSSATSAFPDFGAGGTYQEVYASNAFSGPITITQIAFSSSSSLTSGPGTATYNFNLALSTTAAGPGGLSTDLAANRGNDFVQVFSGEHIANITKDDQFDVVINITPFTYDPANGNLLLDVTMNSPTQFTGGTTLYFRAGNSSNTSRAYNPTGAGAATDSFGLFTRFTTLGPTAADVSISGQVLDATDTVLPGVVIRVTGGTASATITNASGTYEFKNAGAGGFYTITPELANYHFSPASRSFSLVGSETDVMFVAFPDPVASANVIDSNEYFVRQHYLDFLNREPDQQGLLYWSNRLNQCGADSACLRQGRINVSAAFFKSLEFQKTGSYIYRMYEGALGRPMRYVEFSADRQRVVGGANLEADKIAFAEEFVERAEFVQKYQDNTSAESFVDAILQTVRNATGVDLSSERAELIARYNSGSTLNDSRGRVVADMADNDAFGSAVYNPAFVQMEYFGYMRREVDADGYAFWLNVLNDRDAGNYLGMVCSFITSAEYQRRFGTLVTRSNADCGR
jgi:hypothetical protein